MQILPVGTTGTYTIANINGRGYNGTCPNYLGVPACGTTQPVLQSFTPGTTGYQQWTFTTIASTC